MIEIAKTVDKDVVTILLCWAIQQGIAVIPKASSEQRIVSNFAALSLATHNGAVFMNKDDDGDRDGSRTQLLTGSQIETLSRLDRGHHFCWNPDTVT